MTSSNSCNRNKEYKGQIKGDRRGRKRKRFALRVADRLPP